MRNGFYQTRQREHIDGSTIDLMVEQSMYFKNGDHILYQIEVDHPIGNGRKTTTTYPVGHVIIEEEYTSH